MKMDETEADGDVSWPDRACSILAASGSLMRLSLAERKDKMRPGSRLWPWFGAHRFHPGEGGGSAIRPKPRRIGHLSMMSPPIGISRTNIVYTSSELAAREQGHYPFHIDGEALKGTAT